MKFINYKFLLIISILLISLNLAISSCGKKCRSRRNKYKKMKKRTKDLQKKLKEERKKYNELFLEIQSINFILLDCKLDKKHYSSFLEMKSDPVFKTMTFGFPIPRSTSYTGMGGLDSKNNLT